jgi:hypothetical protein
MATLQTILTQETVTVPVQRPYYQPGGEDFGFDLQSLGPDTSAGNTETLDDFGFDDPQPINAAFPRGTEDFETLDDFGFDDPQPINAAFPRGTKDFETLDDFGFDDPQPINAAFPRGTEDFGMDSDVSLPAPKVPQSAGIGAVPLPEAQGDEDFGMDEAQEPLHSSPKARCRS